MSSGARAATLASHLGTAGDYQFTVNANGRLTREQREQYERDGYFIVKGLLSPAEVEQYTQRFLEIAQEGRAPGMIVMRDVKLANKQALGESNVTKIQNLERDPVLFGYCRNPKVLDYVEGVIGPNIKSVHTMLINKPTDLGQGSSRHPPHQDLWYFPFRPAEQVCGAWAALQRIDRQNGCLFVKPGSHTLPLLVHEYPRDGVVNKAYHGIQGMSSEADAATMTDVIMDAGDVVFFHPNLIHGSGRNNSDRFRKAISCHYASSDCVWHLDPKQQAVADEVMSISKGAFADYLDFWRKVKVTLVRGRDGTLS
eukprot:TRINITY_DN12533_c0_g1_i1.p1 TRINITY_DN12533_c0_g1~~TRINITY_DN12533_c0_g1_i1.p1  ORF type:complete len:323 (-),score=77.65 TRINITY_DN12533_c0_g1_i1:152-1084(-)